MFDSKHILLSVVYGSNDGVDRRSLWAHLESIAGSFYNVPWILARDFNVVAHPSESSKFDSSQGTSVDIKDFQECIEHFAIFHHASVGPFFTWSNKQHENFIAKKLDRVMINEEWLCQFSNSKVEFPPLGVSDHYPALVQIYHSEDFPPKPFKFFNFWANHPEFLGVVGNSWKEHIEGDPMVVLHKKLKRLKTNLKEFNKKYFAGLPDKVQSKRRELEAIQVENLNRQPSADDDIQNEKSLSKELHDHLAAEESFYRQKSRVNWLQEGDSNTKYFHRMTTAKHKQNTISILYDSEGKMLNSFVEISSEAVTYFQRLIRTKDDKVESAKPDILLELLTPFSKEACDEMSLPISAEEVKQTLFSINGDKSPGPDGYTACFFKKAWSVVGDDIVKAVLHFFHASKLIPAVNSTIVVLVPKCDHPTNLKDFRPISCCTVIYKCFTKILARIKKHLLAVISANQSAFIKRRSITDNVLLAQELVRGYNRSSISPRCAVKVDLQKAFDSLSWDFIFKVLESMQMPYLFLGWIKACITSPWFSIAVNGGFASYFKGVRGIQQEDPFSSYIFVLA
ncbi:hypothetical protein DITRI_Ditri04bG0050900 [Diplodiscus trichospermus]